MPNLDKGGLQRWEKISKHEMDVDKFSGFFLPHTREYFKRPVSENFIHFSPKPMAACHVSTPIVDNNTFIV
ncbi:MAG: hypothetical protein KDC75_27060, partial [Phaeodactylibacter sp.]|nr:hypothetical protein [Phaeodactylibacter sp.]